MRASPLVIVTKPVDADAESTSIAVLKLVKLLEAVVESVLSVSDSDAAPVEPEADRSAMLLWTEASTVESEPALSAIDVDTFPIVLFAPSRPVDNDAMPPDNVDWPDDNETTPPEIDADSALRSLPVETRPVERESMPVAVEMDNAVKLDDSDDSEPDVDVDNES